MKEFPFFLLPEMILIVFIYVIVLSLEIFNVGLFLEQLPAFLNVSLLKKSLSEITIFDALKEDDDLKIIAIYNYNSGQVTQEKIAFSDISHISQEDLPEQDAYAFMMPDNVYDNLLLVNNVNHLA